MLGAALACALSCVAHGGRTPPAPGLADARPLEAVQCRLVESVQSRPGLVGSQAQRTLTVRMGESGTLSLGPLVLRNFVHARGFLVSAHAGEREILRASHELPERHPAVCFLGEHGFGLVYFSIPGVDYQLSCRAVPRSRDPDRASHEAERRQRELEARRQALYNTLYAREDCQLSAAQQQARELCEPKHPLRARAEAMTALHQMRQRIFPELRLEGADLAKADLREAQLSGARLAFANLRGTSLYFDNLSRADLRHSNLEGANLYGANLTDTNLEGANLRGATLERATLDGAKLAGADLSGAYLAHAKLDGADLSGVDLSRANFEGAMLRGTTLVGANLAQTQLKQARCDGANLQGAHNLTQAQLGQAHGDAFTRLPQGLSIVAAP
jgi:uncharacterized protein YjbI with pentapeptide repeats